MARKEAGMMNVFLVGKDFQGPACIDLKDYVTAMEIQEAKDQRYPWTLIEKLEEMFGLERSNHPAHVPDIFNDWEEVSEDANIDGYANCMCGKKDIRRVYYLRKRIEDDKYAEISVGSVCRNLFKKGSAEEADDALEALCSTPLRAVFRGRRFPKRNVFKVHAQDMPFDERVLKYLKTLFPFLLIDWKGSECVLQVRMERSAQETELAVGEVYDISLQCEKYVRDYGAGIDLRVFQVDLVEQEQEEGEDDEEEEDDWEEEERVRGVGN